MRVSFSQYSMWSSCPQQYKLRYIDKLGVSSSNIHTLFGSAAHETIQHYLEVMYSQSKKIADEIDLNGLLLQRLKENFTKERESAGKDVCTKEELNEFYEDGKLMLAWFKKNITKFFGSKGVRLVGIEIPLTVNLKGELEFVGFIDAVIEDLYDNTYTIIDFKTSTRGWNKYQKDDEIKNSQILIYKKFYSDLFSVPLDAIKVEFQILKRKLDESSPYPMPYVSKHVPSNGSPSIKKAMGSFMNFVDTVFDDEGKHRDIPYPKNPGKGNKNCKYCEFMERGICDGKI
jgi:hypothetical protein